MAIGLDMKMEIHMRQRPPPPLTRVTAEVVLLRLRRDEAKNNPLGNLVQRIRLMQRRLRRKMLDLEVEVMMEDREGGMRVDVDVEEDLAGKVMRRKS